jgi:multidrug resistance efflux pump
LDRGVVALDATDRMKGDAESRKSGYRTATQNIKGRPSRVEQAQAGLERTRLRAPFDRPLAEIDGEFVRRSQAIR